MPLYQPYLSVFACDKGIDRYRHIAGEKNMTLSEFFQQLADPIDPVAQSLEDEY